MGEVKNIPELMAKIPKAVHGGSWPYNEGYVDYDTLSRLGDYMRGRFALTSDEAFRDATPFSTMPDERSWQMPVQGVQYPDGKLVLHAILLS